MKFTYKIMMPVLAAVLLATGCEKEKIDFGGSGKPDAETGYLVLSGMNVNVNADSETIGTRANETTEKKTVAASDDYVVTISSETTGEEVWHKPYGEIRNISEPIALQPGQYIIRAKSPDFDNMALAGWECPAYAGEVKVTIMKGATTQAPTVICKLANIKISIFFSDLLKSKFRETPEHPLQATVKLGENSLVFGRNETRSGYFKALQSINKLEVTLTGEYNTANDGEDPVYKVVSMTQTVDNVRAGQWRKATFAIQVSDEGNMTFSIQVDTWVDDEPISVDAMSLYACIEESIPDDQEVSDPDAPKVTLDNYDITKPFILDGNDFDEWGNCTNLIRIALTPAENAEVDRVTVKFSSDNENLLAALAAAGYDDRIDITTDVTVKEIQYTKVGTSGRAKTIVTSHEAMKWLFGFAGTHTLRIAATDSQHRTSYTDLTITVLRGGTEGPTITWRGQSDDYFDTVHSIDDIKELIIDVTSDTGITGFEVEIISKELNSDALADVGLKDKFDLINPGEIKGNLETLGLPVGDEVNNKRAVVFDISKFMTMLKAFAGTHEFKLTVSDASGTVTKRVILSVQN